MSGMPWVKIYTEILDDVKLSRLSDEQKWRFIQLILLAAECDAEGALVTGDTSMTHAEVSWRLRCDTKTLSQDIEKLADQGLVYYEDDALIVAKFSDRQGPTQEEKRKQWRERQQKRRFNAKKKIVTRDTSVTPALVTPLEEEKEEEEEERLNNHDYSRLSAAFVNATKIPELTGGIDKWVKALDKLGTAGVEESDIENAVTILREKDYSITSLSSIVNAAISEMSKRKGKKVQRAQGISYA